MDRKSNSNSFKNFSRDALSGAIAGMAARILTAPFDVLKIRYQLQSSSKYKTIMQSFSTIIKEEGFFSLWKGNLSATLLWVSYAVVQFSCYGFLKNMINEKELEQNTPKKKNSLCFPNLRKSFALFLAGAGAGTFATVTTYPFDIMRTQFALQGKNKVFKTIPSFLVNTIKEKGVRGLYSGLTPAVIGITPYMGLNFALYEGFKPLTKPSKEDGIFKAVFKKGLAGGASGGLSKLLVYPLDTVKKKLQAQYLHNTMEISSSAVRYKNSFDCVRQVFASEGIRGFYKGLIPTTIKSIFATAITFAAYEGAKDILKEYEKENEKN